MWEYEVITVDYDAEKLADGLKGHPGIAAILSSYGANDWEVVTATALPGPSGPMFVLRRPVREGASSSSDRDRSARR